MSCPKKLEVGKLVHLSEEADIDRRWFADVLRDYRLHGLSDHIGALNIFARWLSNPREEVRFGGVVQAVGFGSKYEQASSQSGLEPRTA